MTIPCLGFGFWTEGEGGIGSFNIPVILSYEMGAGSTYSTVQDIGFFIGAGYETSRTPLATFEKLTWRDLKPVKLSWSQPILHMGIRFWRKPQNAFTREGKERLNSVGIKAGMGAMKSFRDKDNGFMDESRSWSFRLYYSMFIGY